MSFEVDVRAVCEKNHRVLPTAFTVFIALSMLIWSAASELAAKPCPTPRPGIPPMIVGFAGWTMPFTSYHGSAVEQIMDRLRAKGANAEIYPPEIWPQVAERLVTNRVADQPVVLVGFSMGAGAAIHVAERLAAAGIPVRRLVAVEAWYPDPVPANVGDTTHYYSTGFASMLKPGAGAGGSIENIDLKGVIPGIQDASHVEMSRMAAVQELVTDKIEGATPQAPAAEPTAVRPARGTARTRASATRCAGPEAVPTR